jgi:hypothetical protein
MYAAMSLSVTGLLLADKAQTKQLASTHYAYIAVMLALLQCASLFVALNYHDIEDVFCALLEYFIDA